ncbi:MAG: glycosyltransferase family 2 protein [Planctomycetes bacterium]|nr:glycosyltransferase family 2 protein [Planctomycetota bacterium]MBU1519053.1 glycosyltransferase family 2 protein [Planctomycetota bacterium]MBU2596391.1 glycosyltransferase family 2 protein [Planctomycetota bacterium]
MINILFPMVGKSQFFNTEEYIFPKPLIEINGEPMIEIAIENYKKIKLSKNFIFIVSSEHCSKYHLDDILYLLTDRKCIVIKLANETAGAACSALMAVDYINNKEELIIANSDQIIDDEIETIINSFRLKKVDAGVVCFDSVHPRWSFVRLDKNNKIIEAAEKKPLSKNAIAGFYYFKEGKLFVEAAMKSILKARHVNGIYYVAPVLNELVLENKNLEIYKIMNDKYHTFYSPQKISEYENRNINRWKD